LKLLLELVENDQANAMLYSKETLAILTSGMNFITQAILLLQLEEYQVDDTDEIDIYQSDLVEDAINLYIELSKNERFTFQIIHDSLYSTKNLNNLKLLIQDEDDEDENIDDLIIFRWYIFHLMYF
jgi:hypothetical protein